MGALDCIEGGTSIAGVDYVWSLTSLQWSFRRGVTQTQTRFVYLRINTIKRSVILLFIYFILCYMDN